MKFLGPVLLLACLSPDEVSAALLGKASADSYEVLAASEAVVDMFSRAEELRKLEETLILASGATKEDPEWEAQLTPSQRKDLAKARFLYDVASVSAFEKNLVTFGVLGEDSNGNTIYPEMKMQGGEFKGKLRPWTVAFREPKEGEIIFEGKALRGQDFRDFLDQHDGMTSPDGTTIVWGKGFWKNPLRFPQVLYHELCHYQIFSEKTWTEEKTWAEREEEAYKRTRDIAANLGLTPSGQLALEKEIDAMALGFGSQVSLEKSQLEQQRTWLDRLGDRLREWRGLPPVKENPGYSIAAGYSIKPDALKKIRSEAERIRAEVRAENELRHDETRRREKQRSSYESARKADDEAYEAIGRWAERACASWNGKIDDPLADEWYRVRDAHVLHTGPSDGRVDVRPLTTQMPCAAYLRDSVIHEPGRLTDEHRMRMDAWWAADRVREGRNRAAATPARAVATPAQGQGRAPLPPPPPQEVPPPSGDIGNDRPTPPVSEPCFGGGYRCGPVPR